METTVLETFRVMFEGFILFGYITLGIITFIKNRPEMKKLRLGFLSKIVVFIFCITISPLFFWGSYKIIKRD
jgi:hypothetical protein